MDIYWIGVFIYVAYKCAGIKESESKKKMLSYAFEVLPEALFWPFLVIVDIIKSTRKGN